MQKYIDWVASMLVVSCCVANLDNLSSAMAEQNFTDVPHRDLQVALATNKSICQNTLSAVRSHLGLVKSVRLKQIGANAGKYPRGRLMVADVTIVNNNPRSEQLINSPAKLLAASQKIAKNCANVGMVRFYIDQTDNGVVYGLINGRMKQFVCNNEMPIKWGEVMCP